MMGHRGCSDGVGDDDAFDRGWRRILRWRRGRLARIKRTYAKRLRKMARLEARAAAG